MIIDLSRFRKTVTSAAPPDAEKMNDERATRAGAALLFFQKESGADDKNMLMDLLCDLMHWSDRNGGDFDDVLRRAKRLYDAEISPAPIEQPRNLPDEAANIQPPYWMQRIQEFVAIEIQPHMVLRGSSCGSYLEPCELEKAEVWTVNGRYSDGRIEPCGDFPTEARARQFRAGLMSRYPHLARGLHTVETDPGASR